jgi:hypothetical protein
VSCRHWTRTIRGAQDFELGLERTSALTFHATAPADGRARGVAFVIPDFNDDAEGELFAGLRANLAQSHGLLAVTVEYHCYRSRIRDGAQFDLSDGEFAALRKICEGHLVPLIDRNALLPALARLPKHYEFELRVVPHNGDYQNFGVMQALDHLHVLHYLQGEAGNLECPVAIALGAGYAGYIACLMAKFAPNAFRAVMAVDTPTAPPLSYLFGAAAGGEASYYYHAGNVRIFPLVATRWVQDPGSPAGFSLSRQEVRDLVLPFHLGTAKLATRRGMGCAFRLRSTGEGSSATAAAAKAHCEALGAAGFDADWDLLPMHGSAGVAPPLAMLAEACQEVIGVANSSPTADIASSVAYLSGDLLYSFEFDEHGPQAFAVPLARQRGHLRFY